MVLNSIDLGEIVLQLPSEAAKLLESRCYRTLEEIRRIVHDTTLDDAACFERIEAIIIAYEKVGSNGGDRHDFG